MYFYNFFVALTSYYEYILCSIIDKEKQYLHLEWFPENLDVTMLFVDAFILNVTITIQSMTPQTVYGSC